MNTIKSVNWLSAYNCAWDSGGQCSHGGCRRGRVRRYRHAAGACAAHAMSEEEGDAPVIREQTSQRCFRHSQQWRARCRI